MPRVISSAAAIANISATAATLRITARVRRTSPSIGSSDWTSISVHITLLRPGSSMRA